jgi:DNA-binding NarL/FixJ family response regulator
MSHMMPTRVVLADDHVLVRSGVKALLTSSEIDVVAEAKDGRELLAAVREHRPDIAIVDLSMPLLDGFEAIRRIPSMSPETRVIVLSMHHDARYADRAGRLGAWAYLMKDEAPERLIGVIQQVAGGRRLLAAKEAVAERLSSREREVLQLIVEGKKNAEIARVMRRSVHTVRNHRARLMRKLGARNAAELVAVADTQGLIYLSAPGRPT